MNNLGIREDRDLNYLFSFFGRWYASAFICCVKSYFLRILIAFKWLTISLHDDILKKVASIIIIFHRSQNLYNYSNFFTSNLYVRIKLNPITNPCQTISIVPIPLPPLKKKEHNPSSAVNFSNLRINSPDREVILHHVINQGRALFVRRFINHNRMA